MHRVSLNEAQKRLAELIDEAAQGESVIIAQDDGPSVKLIPLTQSPPRPRFGSARGQIKMSEDFDAPLEDFEDYAP